MRQYGLKLSLLRGAVFPGFQRSENCSDVRIVRGSDEIQAAECGYLLNSRSRSENFFDLCRRVLVAADRSAIGQADGGKENSLVFIGEEPGGKGFEQKAGSQVQRRKRNHGQRGPADQNTNACEITMGGPLESLIESIEEAPEQSACRTP